MMSSETRQGPAQAARVVEQLRPRLAELERERMQLREQTLRLLVVIGAASAIIALLVRLVLGSGWGGVAFLVLIAGVVVAGWQIVRRQTRWEQQVLDAVIPVICQSLGDIAYQPGVEVGDFLPAFEKLGVVGHSNRQRLRHYFRGRHQQTGFEFVDAALDRTSSRKGKGNGGDAVTVFQGLLFRIQLPFSVDQRLLISPRVSIKLFNKRADMCEITLGDEAFDEKFVVHHDMDQTDGAALAEQVLTADFRRALLELNQQEGKLAYELGAFVIGLMYDSLYMAKTRYQRSGSIGKLQIEKPVPFLDVRFFLFRDSRLEEGVGRMVDDVATVYRVIHTLPLAPVNPAKTSAPAH